MTERIPAFVFFISIFLASPPLAAQNRMSSEDYIIRYKEVALKKMQTYRIPASITLAQGMLESGNGNSVLAREANNHFGIKCHKEWTGKTFFMDDDEKNECFRAYQHAEESYEDHSLFLTSRSRYGALFNLPLMDYKAWADGLKEAGYATNPHYSKLLSGLIERYRLYHYDSIAMGLIGEKPDGTPVALHPNPVVNPADFKMVKQIKSGRTVYQNNRKKLIFLSKGDNIAGLAKELGMFSWQLRKYNELTKSDSLLEGSFIYVEKKARKSFSYTDHFLHEGESLKELSQRYGIRLTQLLKMNDLPNDNSLPAGTLIRLR